MQRELTDIITEKIEKWDHLNNNSNKTTVTKKI